MTVTEAYEAAKATRIAAWHKVAALANVEAHNADVAHHAAKADLAAARAAETAALAAL